MYINKAMLFGNLTRDPELRALPSGMNVVNFGRQADLVNQYLKKGSSVFVEGRIQTRSWEKDGEKKYRTEVVADRVQFGRKASGGGARSASTSQGDDQTPPEDMAGGGGSGIEYPKDNINPDDIP